MPRSCGANGHFQRGRAAYSSTGFKLRLNQRRIEEEEKRRRRIKHIDSGDAPVGKILLGKKHRRAVDVGGEAMRCERLAIGQNGKLSVVLAAGLFEIVGQLAVECFAALLESWILASASASICSTVMSIALPVGAQLAAQILDRVLLGISE